MRISLVLAGMAAAGAAGCSLLIDLEADCEDANCAPYVCDSDAVACLDACFQDQDCAAGALCNAETRMCEETGCSALTGVIELEAMRGDRTEMEAAFGADQLVIVAGTPLGAGFRRFRGGSGALIGDPPDESTGLYPLAGSSDQRSPYLPRVAFLPADDSGNPADRFTFVWRHAEPTVDDIRVAALTVDPLGFEGGFNAYVSPMRVELTTPSFVRTAGGLMLAWTFIGGRQTVQTLDTTLSGRRPDGEGGGQGDGDELAISDPIQLASLPSLVSVGGAVFAIYRATGSGSSTIYAQRLSPEGEADGSPDGIPVEGGAAISGLVTASSGTTGAIAWAEERGASYQVFLAGLSENGISEGAHRIDTSFTHNDSARAARLSAAGGAGAVGVMWLGERSGREDLYFARFDASGTAVGLPHPVTGSDIGDLRSFSLVRTPDGFAAVWMVPEPEPTDETEDHERVYFRRFACGP